MQSELEYRSLGAANDDRHALHWLRVDRQAALLLHVLPCIMRLYVGSA